MLTLLGRLRKFQSTPPARAATPHAGDCARGRMFQSTPPARAATVPIMAEPARRSCFNPRRPRGRRLSIVKYRCRENCVSIHAAREGGDRVRSAIAHAGVVSIHAAREGGDATAPTMVREVVSFNPRRPRGRRPAWRALRPPRLVVSIHAAREGGDLEVPKAPVTVLSFNPRRPRGRRLRSADAWTVQQQFQSTPPARAATGAT